MPRSWRRPWGYPRWSRSAPQCSPCRMARRSCSMRSAASSRSIPARHASWQHALKWPRGRRSAPRWPRPRSASATPRTERASRCSPTSARSPRRRPRCVTAPRAAGCCAPSSCFSTACHRPPKPSRPPSTRRSPMCSGRGRSPSAPSMPAGTSRSPTCRCPRRRIPHSGCVACARASHSRSCCARSCVRCWRSAAPLNAACSCR